MSQSHYYTPLLFDRLTQGDDEVVDAAGSVDLLLDSIRREIEDLLTTRVTAKKVLMEGEATQGYYTYAVPYGAGIYEATAFDGTNPQEWRRLERYLALCIEAFEPRLRRVVPKIQSFDKLTQKLVLSIQGTIVTNDQEMPVHFSLDYNPMS